MEWNKNNWQGKSERQVKFSYYMASISFVIVTIVMIWLLLAALTSCKSTEKIDCDAYSQNGTTRVETTK